MTLVKMYIKFLWIYTTSMFLPTAIITPRIERALKELEEGKQELARQKQARQAG